MAGCGLHGDTRRYRCRFAIRLQSINLWELVEVPAKVGMGISAVRPGWAGLFMATRIALVCTHRVGLASLSRAKMVSATAPRSDRNGFRRDAVYSDDGVLGSMVGRDVLLGPFDHARRSVPDAPAGCINWLPDMEHQCASPGSDMVNCRCFCGLRRRRCVLVRTYLEQAPVADAVS